MKEMVMTYIGLLATLTLGGCAMSATDAGAAEEARARRRAEVAESVKEGLQDRRFTVDVRQMYPMSGPARALDPVYTLELRGDTVLSGLPYFGRAYSVPYGGGKGLNFTATMSDYELERDKNCWHATLTVKNDEDTYRYHLVVYDNAAATIDVLSNNREPISFSGIMDN